MATRSEIRAEIDARHEAVRAASREQQRAMSAGDREAKAAADATIREHRAAVRSLDDRIGRLAQRVVAEHRHGSPDDAEDQSGWDCMP